MEDLNTDRLVLRKWKMTDSKDLYEYAKSELVGPYAGWFSHRNEDESKEVIKGFIRDKEVYAIVLKSENKVIGSIGLHDRYQSYGVVDLKEKSMGYVLSPNYWGRGIMPEAVTCVVDYGFNKLNLDIIWCGHFDYNKNSRRVIEKCGFKYKYKKKKKLSSLNNREVVVLYYNTTKQDYFGLNNYK